MTLRAWHARLSLGVALLTALAFALPLAFLAAQQAADRARQQSERRAATLVAVLGTTRDPEAVREARQRTGDDAASTCVRLGETVVGTCQAPVTEAVRVAEHGKAVRGGPYGGEEVLLLPVSLPGGTTAVIESVVRAEERSAGVMTAWGVLAAAVTVLTVLSVSAADRIARRLNQAYAELAQATRSVGEGDFAVHVGAEGPREVRRVAEAMNTMAERIAELMRAEREMTADLSHRLRTPLTALRLEADLMPPAQSARLRSGLIALDRELTSVIEATRTRRSAPQPSEQGCDLAAVVHDRMAFWGELARAQGRTCEVSAAWTPRVHGLRQDLVAALDALVGNVFRHTPPGTWFAVRTERPAGAVRLVVEDAGPGIEAPHYAVQRGRSEAGSSGLGLDIVGRAAKAAGGSVTLDRGDRGGARITVTIPAPGAADRAL
ncbi:sensor histidine kinase [Streptomyces sp. HK10]|uniref:sensor histidine kinase n=1 Tax=Streptomyces sp. HK10 TaxID=3373255 RepID=UPI0037491D41